ncbi:hypothetical protein ACHAQH_005486 [Verticillium albo-atrum]
MASEPEPRAADAAALDELNSAETRTLFDTADKLSALGVGRLVNLPQIIVVGDQSSGKSSVLEALSHVHFPSHGGVCTRFATELVLRKGPRRRVEAAIRFADSKKPAHTLQADDFGQADIDRIFTEAKELMNLSDGPGYSKDVLRMEIEGPDMYPLTLVDLPGIYHTPTDKQSSAGIPIVKELVGSYMEKTNSIILAIVSASSQLANQIVMEEAAQHDPTKERTLGVVTKPDLLPKDSSEEGEYNRLIRNNNTAHKLKLGWHAVRNCADYEGDQGPRDKVEDDFFSSGIWASLPPTDRGISALRKKLSKVLHDHIKKSLPAVLDDIQAQLAEREGELSRLGQHRSKPEDMRAYLVDAALNFQRLVGNGIRGQYNDPFFGGFDGTERKLRARLRIFNRAIRHVLLLHGSTYNIIQHEEEALNEELEVPSHLEDFLASGIYQDLPAPQIITRAQLSVELERQAAANQGTELPGYANMDLVTQLFQKQAGPWEVIAEQHLDNVTATVRAFVEDVISDIIGPSNADSTFALLTAHVYPFFEEKEQVLAEKLQEILRPFKEAYASPLDADFYEAMEKAVAERVMTAESDDKDENRPHMGSPSPGGNEFGTERIIDTVQTFYNMSLRTFTDNLINLAVESCLVRQLPDILSPRTVTDMSDETLSALAAESEEVCHRREQLQGDITLLKKGLEQCRRYRPRLEFASSSQPKPAKSEQELKELSRLDAALKSSKNQTTSAEKAAQPSSTASPFGGPPKPSENTRAFGSASGFGSTSTPNASGGAFGSSNAALGASETTATSQASKGAGFSFGQPSNALAPPPSVFGSPSPPAGNETSTGGASGGGFGAFSTSSGGPFGGSGSGGGFGSVSAAGSQGQQTGTGSAGFGTSNASSAWTPTPKSWGTSKK